MAFPYLGQRSRQTLEERGVVELARDVVETIFDPLPFLRLERLTLGLADLLAHLLAVSVLIDLRPRDAEDREFLRQEAVFNQIEDRRKQFASREISGRAEDHEDARVSALARHGRRTARAMRRGAFQRRYGRAAIGSARRAPPSARQRTLLR